MGFVSTNNHNRSDQQAFQKPADIGTQRDSTNPNPASNKTPDPALNELANNTDLNNSNQDQGKEPNQFHKKAGELLEKVKYDKGFFPMFLAGYGALTCLGVLTDFLENPCAMILRPLNNAFATRHEAIPEGHRLNTYINDALKPSGFKKFLEPIGNLLGITPENGMPYDGLLTFGARMMQKVLEKPYAWMGLKMPFNLPTDRDLEQAADAKTDFNFIGHRDMEVVGEDENGQPIFKDPRGHVRKWTNQVNPNPSINADPNRSFFKKLNYPTASRQSLSLAFLIRNGASIFFEKAPKNLGAIGKALNVAKLGSSFISATVGPVSAFMSWLFAIYGKSSLISAANLLSLISAISIPTNHGAENLVKMISARNTSKKEGTTFKEEMQKMDMWNPGRILHGIVGGLTMIPTNIGFVARMLQVYCQTRYFFVKAAREFAGLVHGVMHKYGMVKNEDSSKWQNGLASVVTGVATGLHKFAVPAVEAIVNSAPLKPLLSKFFATTTDETTGEKKVSFDIYRKILEDIMISGTLTNEEINAREAQDIEEGKYKYFMGAPTADAEAKDLAKETSKDNLWLGFIPKYQSMMSLFKTIAAIPTWTVTASYAFEPRLDKDIQRAKGPLSMVFKGVDQFLGNITRLFAIPNVLVYGFTARFPQAFAGVCDMVQRYADAKGWAGKDGDKYNVMKEFINPFTDKMLNSKIPFFRWIGKNLNEDFRYNPQNKDNDLFTDQGKANYLLTQHFENISFKEEYSTEWSVILKALRGGMKRVLEGSGAYANAG